MDCSSPPALITLDSLNNFSDSTAEGNTWTEQMQLDSSQLHTRESKLHWECSAFSYYAHMLRGGVRAAYSP